MGGGKTAKAKRLDAKYDDEAYEPKWKSKCGEDKKLETPSLVIHVAWVGRMEKR